VIGCCANADAEGEDAFNVVGSAPYLYDVTDADVPKVILASTFLTPLRGHSQVTASQISTGPSSWNAERSPARRTGHGLRGTARRWSLSRVAGGE
jgi:hypothetical protein